MRLTRREPFMKCSIITCDWLSNTAASSRKKETERLSRKCFAKRILRCLPRNMSNSTYRISILEDWTCMCGVYKDSDWSRPLTSETVALAPAVDDCSHTKCYWKMQSLSAFNWQSRWSWKSIMNLEHSRACCLAHLADFSVWFAWERQLMRPN